MFPLKYIRMHRGLVERYLRVYRGQCHGLRETKLLAIPPSKRGRIPGHFHFLLIHVSVVLAFCHLCIVFVNKTNIGDDLQENTPGMSAAARGLRSVRTAVLHRCSGFHPEPTTHELFLISARPGVSSRQVGITVLHNVRKNRNRSCKNSTY